MMRRLGLVCLLMLSLSLPIVAQADRSVIVPGNAQLVTDLGALSVTESLNDAAFSPDSKYVATVGDDTAVRIWDVASGEQIAEAFEHFLFVKAVVWRDDFLVTGSWDRTAIIWDVTNGVPTVREVVAGYDGVVDALAADSTSEKIVLGVADGAARVYDVSSSSIIASLPVESLRVTAVAYSPDGVSIVTAGGYPASGAVLWDALTFEKISDIAHPGTVMSLAHASSGLLAVGGDDGTVTLWLDGAQIAALDQSDWVLDIAFNPAGDVLAVARQDGVLTLWDVSAPESADLIVAIVASDSAALTSAAFSPDGRLIVTTDEDGTARLWGVEVK